jgi:hypothetical protein
LDLNKILSALHAKKRALERTIIELENSQRGVGQLPTPTLSAKRRGRKSMDATERRQVTARMKKYWASRRQSAGNVR